MRSWPARSTPTWSEISTSRRHLPRRSPAASSTGWRQGTRRSSPTRCPRRWRRAGALVRPRRSSARTPRSSQGPSRRKHGRRRDELRQKLAGYWRERDQAAVTTRRREKMTDHNIGTREEWLAEREHLLSREKEHTRLGDELARQRRELPWVPVDREYRFDTEDGEKTLAELFDGRSQLLVYHFMFGPSYDAGCPTCSSMADGINGVLPHLHARDVTFIFVSQAPLQKLQAYRRRMGWSVPWVSSEPADFNYEIGFSHTVEQTREAVPPEMEAALPPIAARNASETGTDLVSYISEGFGFSAFVLDDGAAYHTYSTTDRGVEFLMGYYQILDRAAKGRDEGNAWQVWIRRHDEYRQ